MYRPTAFPNQPFLYSICWFRVVENVFLNILLRYFWCVLSILMVGCVVILGLYELPSAHHSINTCVSSACFHILPLTLPLLSLCPSVLCLFSLSLILCTSVSRWLPRKFQIHFHTDGTPCCHRIVCLLVCVMFHRWPTHDHASIRFTSLWAHTTVSCRIGCKLYCLFLNKKDEVELYEIK